MSMPVVLTLGLLILPIIWFLTDPRPLHERLRQSLTLNGIIVSVIEFILIYFNFNHPNTLILNNIMNAAVVPIGIILYTVGSSIAIWAKITMGKVWGMSAEHDLSRQNKLISSGPFKHSRNPIYLGLTLTLLGYSLVFKSIFIILNILVIFYFYYDAKKEEKILEKYFGKAYLKYKSQVPLFL